MQMNGRAVIYRYVKWFEILILDNFGVNNLIVFIERNLCGNWYYSNELL